MIDLVRSYSMPVGSAFQLDLQPDDFLDQHGAIRRSSSIARGAVLQHGASDAKLDFLAPATPVEPPADDDTSEIADDDHGFAPVPGSLLPQELAALKQTQEEKKRRRSEMILNLRERKRSVLVEQCAKVQERVQLWYDASELDPNVETSAEHTLLSPSSKARTYIDSDGNLRRKSVEQPRSPQQCASPSPSPRLDSPLSAFFPQARKSLVLEFLQSIIDD